MKSTIHLKLIKFPKLKGSGIKKALTRAEIRKIEDLQFKYPHLAVKKTLLISYYTSKLL
jgi:hypothetical protein